MWVIAATERRNITRIVCEQEELAREIHKCLLPEVGKQYLAVSLQTVHEEPMRSDEEVTRAAVLLKKLVRRLNQL